MKLAATALAVVGIPEAVVARLNASVPPEVREVPFVEDRVSVTRTGAANGTKEPPVAP